MINIFPKKNTDLRSSAVEEVLDATWMKSSFILSDKDTANGGAYATYIRNNRYYTSADAKFTCSSPGMSMAVNPKPQYTRYCDPRRKGRISDRPDVTVTTKSHPMGLGQGPFYSEAHDDNQQRVFFRFGVPKYMSLMYWTIKAFDVDKAALQGRGFITTSLLQGIGVLGTLWAIAAAPLLSLGAFLFNVGVQSSRFYSVKDTMYVYWATAENILNALVTRRTMVPQVLSDYSNKQSNQINRESKVTPNFVKELNSLIPDIVNEETGRISVFAIALRAQVAFNKMLKADADLNETKKLSEDFSGYPIGRESSHDTYFTNSKGKATFFVDKLFRNAYDLIIKDNPDEEGGNLDSEDSAASMIQIDPLYTGVDGSALDLTVDPNDPNSSVDGIVAKNFDDKASSRTSMQEYLLAELSEGGSFAVFNVEHTGSVGESFSNSLTSNPIESMFNSVSAKARNMGSFLDSATGLPIVGDAMKFAKDAGAVLLSKASFGLANPLLALAYGVNISMPKVWESSSASLPKANYKIRLISPYGNAYSQLFNIYLPFSLLLAGSLPRSTGNSSYMAPFVCQTFDRGRVNNQLSMITELNITRGTSNLAFTRTGHPNAIDVDIGVTSMDEVISVDVSSNGVLSKGLAALSPSFADTPFTSYMNTVAAVDVYTQVYRIPMLRLKLAERIMDLKAIIEPDPAAFAAFGVNKLPGEGLLKTLLGNNAQTLSSIMAQ